MQSLAMVQAKRLQRWKIGMPVLQHLYRSQIRERQLTAIQAEMIQFLPPRRQQHVDVPDAPVLRQGGLPAWLEPKGGEIWHDDVEVEQICLEAVPIPDDNGYCVEGS